MSATSARVEVLRGQLALAGALADVTLADLTDDECLWSPSPRSWTVRVGDDGRWRADWEVPEPADLPPPTLAWTLWHTLWWWSVLLDQVSGPGSLTREDVVWPGAHEALAQLGSLRDRWDAYLASLTDDDLDAATPTRFPYDDGRALASVAGWVTVELAKNVAEMSMLRRLARVTRGPLPGR